MNPVVTATLLCDQVIVDALSGKKSLIGIFDRISATDFPSVHTRMVLFVSMTEWHGNKNWRVRIQDSQLHIIFNIEGTHEHLDPLQPVDFMFDMVGIIFPSEGDYQLEVSVDGTFISQRSIIVRRIPSPPR